MILDTALSTARNWEQIKSQNASSSTAANAVTDLYVDTQRGQGRGQGHQSTPLTAVGHTGSTVVQEVAVEANVQVNRQATHKMGDTINSGKAGVKDNFEATSVIVAHQSVNTGFCQSPERQNCPPRNTECHHAVSQDGTLWEEMSQWHIMQHSLVGAQTYVEHEAPRHKALHIQGGTVDFKLDSGVDVSIISEATFKKLCPQPTLDEEMSKLQSPGGQIRYLGQFTAIAQDNSQTCQF